jgi:hypothetical protein
MLINKKIFVILVFLICGMVSQVAAQIPNHPYPRTGIFQFGRAVPDWYARFDLVIVSTENSAFAKEVKQLNPQTAFLPTRGWTTWSSQSDHRFPEGTKEYWLTPTSTGEPAGAEWNSILIDMTNFCPKFNGKRFNEAYPEFLLSQIDLTVFDGIASDWLWSKPHNLTDLDFDRNGRNDYVEHGKDWVEQVWLEGVEELLSNFREQMPSEKLIVINSGLFHEFGWDKTNGVVLEWWSGLPSWSYFSRIYQRWMESSRQPQALIMDTKVDGGDPFRPDEPKNYFRLMRFMLTATMLGNGYFDFSDPKSGHHYHRYYDEFDLNLGYPTGPFQELSTGIAVRFFDRGVSIINPSGSTKRVSESDLQSLSGYRGPYYRFKGGQDPSFNNGARFDSIELWGEIDPRNGWRIFGDGIILVNEPMTVVSDITIDNLDYGTSPSSRPAKFIGSWEQTDRGGNSHFLIDRAGSDWYPHAFTQPGDGSSRAIFTPTIGVSGKYEVFEWHGYIDGASMATNVPCKITSADGVKNVTIDQSKNQGRWNSLGVFTFGAGRFGSVEISNNANGVVVADVIKFVFKENTPVVTDNIPPASPSGLKIKEIGN